MRLKFALGGLILIFSGLFFFRQISTTSHLDQSSDAPSDHRPHTTYDGPLIRLLICSRANYEPGAVADCHLYLKNRSASVFNGHVKVTMWQGARAIASTPDLPIANLASQQLLTLPVQMTVPPGSQERGYLLIARISDSNGKAIDLASGYIEKAKSYLSFPRPSLIGNPVTTDNAKQQLVSWLAYGVNLPIYFDLYEKAHKPAPDRGATSWTNLEKMEVKRSVVDSFIEMAHQLKMGIWIFEDWYAANDDWSTDGSPLTSEMALYRAPCKTGAHPAPCNLNEQMAIGSNWRKFGWKTDKQPVFDPTNSSYINFFINNMNEFYSQFKFDGMWIDTVGDSLGRAYRANGSQVDLGHALADFSNHVLTGTRKPAFINNVGRWADLDVGQRSHEPFVFSEIWSSSLGSGANDTPYYPSINGAIARYRQVTSKPIVLPAYINDLYRSPDTYGVPEMDTKLNANEATSRYLSDQILASGAYHMTFSDNDGVGSGAYFTEQQLVMNPSLMSAQLDLQHFGIANEDLLRDHVLDSQQPCSIPYHIGDRILGKPIGDTAGGAGYVYTLPKYKKGFNVCHLLSHGGVRDAHWKDEKALHKAPAIYRQFSVKMYYVGKLKDVWFASPDYLHGEPQSLKGHFDLGADQVGTFINVTVPSLFYWDMIVAEVE